MKKQLLPLVILLILLIPETVFADAGRNAAEQQNPAALRLAHFVITRTEDFAAPQPETDTEPQPETDTAPQPETDAAPQPKTTAAPQPETDTAPQPETDAAPQPEPSGTDKMGSLEQILERQVLYVGTAGDYKPMSYLDPETKEYWGFDIEIAKDLAESLGVELVFVGTSWPMLMEDTLSGAFDLAIGGITVTDARKEQALMSDGYFGNGKTVLCRAEDAGRYLSLEAINRPEVRVMENPGGLNEQFARDHLPDAAIIIHDINQEIPGLIASGEADVMITEIMEAGFYAGEDARLAAPLIGEPFTHGELGILMPKGSEELLLFVNAFLADEKDSGRIDELADIYIYRNSQDDLDIAA